jgi:hypothetical protein
VHVEPDVEGAPAERDSALLGEVEVASCDKSRSAEDRSNRFDLAGEAVQVPHDTSDAAGEEP